MIQFGKFTKLALASALGLAILSAPASAGGWNGHHGGGYSQNYYGHGYHGGHRNYGGYVAAGVVGGLLLGGLIASSARAQEPDCWVEQRRVYDNRGYAYLRDVQVCR